MFRPPPQLVRAFFRHYEYIHPGLVVMVFGIVAVWRIGEDLCVAPMLGKESASGTLHVLVMRTLLVIVFTCLARARLVDPGSVPEGWFTQDEHERATRGIAPVYGVPQPCQRCGVVKPERAHHCSAMNRCVLRMDHYCPWVGNCVGAHNHKFFLQLTLYCTVSALYVIVFVLFRFRMLFQDETLVPAGRAASDTISLLVAFAWCLLCFGLSFHLARNHILMAQSNITSIEIAAFPRIISAPRVLGIINYDLGPSRNLRMMFGDSPLHWFLPTRGHYGDGIHFENSGIQYFSDEGDLLTEDEVQGALEREQGSEHKDAPPAGACAPHCEHHHGEPIV